MSASRRRLKAAKRRAEYLKHGAGTRNAMCPNGCGERGPHFIPPSLGDPGFFMCEPATKPRSTEAGS